MKSKLEYIWLDGYFPTQNTRSKTKVIEDSDVKRVIHLAFDTPISTSQEILHFYKAGSNFSLINEIKWLLL